MTEIQKRKKALSVNPLKASSTIGASLAFMGIDRSIPMIHGSQGCTAFGKVFFVQHFQEPIPLQTSALDQIGTVMGSYENLVEGLKTISSKSAPAMIGIPTSGLSEVQGFDVEMAVREFRKAHPEHDDVAVVPVTTPDYAGSLESGFADAVNQILKSCVPEDTSRVGQRPRQINVLVGASMTSGDIETIKDMIEAFGLRPVVVPDISGSLDGHLGPQRFVPLTTGGTPVNELQALGLAKATLVIGSSMEEAANTLRDRTGVPDHRFDHVCGVDATDTLIMLLRELSGEEVPAKYDRQRQQLLDAMLDSHFMLGMTRVALAADPDLLVALTALLKSMGSEITTAVTTLNAPGLQRSGLDVVKIGDLEDLEVTARETGAELLITNSHGVATAERLGIPVYRAGFPQFDWFGGFQKTWVGYAGARQVLFDLANILTQAERGEITPYRSIYGQKLEYQKDYKEA